MKRSARHQGLWSSAKASLPVLAVLLSSSVAAQSLSVLPTTPLRNTPVAPATGPFPLSFSAPVDPASVGAIQLVGTQRRGRWLATPAVQGTTVSLTPTGQAFAGELLSINVPATVRSTSGTLNQAQILRFTTAVTGTGRGTFTMGAPMSLSYISSSPKLADIDNDGDLDLLCPQGSNYVTTSQVVTISLNDGRGTFNRAAPVSVGTGGAPFSLAMADVDNDGDLDLLAACSPGNIISIRLNDGRGGFSGGSEVPVQVESFYVTTGDLDADGDVDLIAYTHTMGQTVASIRLNQGNGTFAGGAELAVTGGSGNLTLGDIDNDGDLDLLTSGFSTGYVYSYLNQGTGLFTAFTTYPLGNNPTDIALADVDTDGDLDMVVGCAGNNTVATRLNDGWGHYAATGASVPVGNYPQRLHLADLDSDGDVDLLTGNLSGNSVSIRFNNAHGVFGGGADLPMGRSVYGLTVGDIDGDRDVDFVASSYDSQSSLQPGFNQGPTCTAADTAASITPAGLFTLACGQTTATLRASIPHADPTATYEWQRFDTASGWQPLSAGGNLPEYAVQQAGQYRVRIRQNGCTATSAATEIRVVPAATYTIPNIFTPNGDSINDVFKLRLTAPRTFKLEVYNRWGSRVFSTDRYGDFWTGAGASAGVYYYYWRYSTECDPVEQTRKGYVTIVR